MFITLQCSGLFYTHFMRSRRTKKFQALAGLLVYNTYPFDNIFFLQYYLLHTINFILSYINLSCCLSKYFKLSARYRLEEAEDRYRSRPSREEDVQLITELQQKIFEQEIECRKLTEERKHYRLELVNREENFNKMFNASPNVGFMNPIGMSKVRLSSLVGSSASVTLYQKTAAKLKFVRLCCNLFTLENV